MESEKVKEIKKVLECCAILTNRDLPMETRDNACHNCPYDDIERCSPLLVKNSLTYVNELESENESCHEVLADLKAIIKQQNDRIAELEKHIERVESERIRIKQDRDKKDELASKFIDSYNDSLKQFAERLKEKAIKLSWEGLGTTDIDETLNEFLNTNKGE